MWASIKNGDEGIVTFHLDEEAARAVVACLIFAARFHQSFAPLALIAERGFGQHVATSAERRSVCQ